MTADLAGMPHLLIAGSTGAGKSVAINAMIMSILYKSTPDQVRLILVDPKRLELGNLRRRAASCLRRSLRSRSWLPMRLRNAVREMERRLKLLAAKGVRNIDQYNKLFDKTARRACLAKMRTRQPLPYIVIIIDELADLMMLDSGNVEESITRLAQMARAVGIHLVLATQRPSVDVITGLIKANFPARISFRVATKIDSRTILDANGAEACSDAATCCICRRDHRACTVCMRRMSPKKKSRPWWSSGGLRARPYRGAVLAGAEDERRERRSWRRQAKKARASTIRCIEDAVRLVIEFGKASTSLLQRRLRIGYGRAAHLIDLMERDGIVGAADGPKPREVLKRPDWLSEVEESMR